MNSNWSYSPEMLNSGQNQQLFVPCDLEIWQLTLKNNRAPLLCKIKLYAWFHRHMWIQTVVTVQKRLNGVLISDLDLWPWPFAWTSLLSLLILEICISHTVILISTIWSENFTIPLWSSICPGLNNDINLENIKVMPGNSHFFTPYLRPLALHVFSR